MTDPKSDTAESIPTSFVGSEAARTTAVTAALINGDTAKLKALVAGLEARDLADLIVALPAADRVNLIQSLGTDFDFDALSELDETVRDELSEALPNDFIARAATELDTDDAAYVIEGLEDDDKRDVLAQMPRTERAALERNLDYPEESAGRLMQANVVAVPPYWSVGQVIDHMREADDLPDTFSDIFVVDPTHHVLGSLDLSRLLRTQRHIVVDKLMENGHHPVLATDDQEEVARLFERYDLRSAPVVDQNQRLVGVVTVDDVVGVFEQEADEDVKRMAGVGDESINDSVQDVALTRFAWLFEIKRILETPSVRKI